MLLPDVNVWLALVFDKHIHHAVAKAWFDGVRDGECSFCRLTQQGLLRLATNPKVFRDEAITLREAWGLYDRTCGDPRVVFTPEPAGIEGPWRNYTQLRSFSPKIWNDAYLAAFAESAQFELVTFDTGFSKFSGPACTVLS